VILNNIGSETHAGMIRDAVAAAIPILGALPRATDLVVPERHLGLHLPHEARAEYVDQLATLVEEHIDLDALLRNSVVKRRQATATAPALPPKARLAVARDEAFCFYYTDNLELLEQAGAELVLFSPISEPLPENIDGIYLGGGYPELHADKLAANTSTLEAIREFAARRGPIYAECGGLMYLAEALEFDGEIHQLCGVLPFRTTMPAPLAIGYVEITTSGGPFGSGQTARGHLFHHSAIAGDPLTDRCYRIKNSRGEETQEGYLVQNVLASYAHLHLASNPALAAAFIDQCATFSSGAGAHRTATVDVAS
jgi:cobyrinic acid a,c-diamide synthase